MMKLKSLTIGTFVMLVFNLMEVKGNEKNTNCSYRDSATEHLREVLKALTVSDYFMFGVPNALTISYNGGPKHPFNDQSDCKDITGSHPAFIESDFEWYDHPDFKEWDIEAMKKAYKAGAVVGYCYHLRSPRDYEYYAYKNEKPINDFHLVKDILSNPDRKTNPNLNWYLTLLDTLVIPVFKELGFPLIYRPFHEMTGNWFWWGTSTCTPEEFVKIYRLTVDYLRDNGIRNVLYAWAPDKSSDMQFYPGDDYVDVIGYDGYDVGIAEWHPIDLFIDNLKKLTDYAYQHNKIAAITEVGLYNLTKYPQYWTKNVFEPIYKNSLHKKIAWIMTWYNADWNHDQKGISYIPYKGIENKDGGIQAINDFIEFYNLPYTIFLNDIPPMYFNKNNSELFVFPKNLKLKLNEEIVLIGGSYNNWFKDTKKWISSNSSIVEIDTTGKLKALKKGKVKITMIFPDGRKAFSEVIVE